MKHGQAVPRPPEPPEVAGDCLALDLIEFEQDPALDEFIEDHQPIAKRWTALAGEPLPLPEPVTFDEIEADQSKREPIEPEGEA
jgi:hypothetical protein